jgi:hemolysin-activating ACP:hemolysin acyltransferase
MSQIRHYSLCTPIGRLDPDSEKGRSCLDIGLLCHFAARTVHLSSSPVGTFVQRILVAQQLQQLKIYVNGYDECVGFVTWAYLSPDVERAFLSGKYRALDEWEYNDGTSPWVLDMVVAPGSLRYVLEDLRDVVFKDCPWLTYFRTKGDKRLFKRVSRQSRASFFSTAREGGQL